MPDPLAQSSGDRWAQAHTSSAPIKPSRVSLRGFGKVILGGSLTVAVIVGLMSNSFGVVLACFCACWGLHVTAAAAQIQGKRQHNASSPHVLRLIYSWATLLAAGLLAWSAASLLVAV